MHNSCTTALEATVSQKPLVTYIPFEQEHGYELPNGLGYRVTSKDELLNKVNGLFDNIKSSDQNNLDDYNPNQKKIEGFTRMELQVLANIMFMLNAIRYALTLQLAIVQIDIAVLSGIFSELAAIPTIYILLKDKEFVDEKPPKTVTYFQL